MASIRRWLRCLAALAATVLAALVCRQCADIYLSGTAAGLQTLYTAQNVAERLRTMALPVCVCAAVILLAVLVHAGSPAERTPHRLAPENRLRLMKRRTGVLPPAALSEERLRRRVRLAAGMLLALCGAGALGFLLDGRNFVSWELEAVLGALLMHVGPAAVLALAVLWGCMAVCDASILRECEALRGAPAAEHRAAEPVKPQHTGVVRLLLYGAAVVFIVLGVMNGGLYDVLVKAINICTECIGLG